MGTSAVIIDAQNSLWLHYRHPIGPGVALPNTALPESGGFATGVLPIGGSESTSHPAGPRTTRHQRYYSFSSAHKSRVTPNSSGSNGPTASRATQKDNLFPPTRHPSVDRAVRAKTAPAPDSPVETDECDSSTDLDSSEHWYEK